MPAHRVEDGISRFSGMTPADVGNGTIDYSGLNDGPPPVRIPRFFRSALTGYQGLRELSYEQNAESFSIIRHFVIPFPTRGYRSVSGAMAATRRVDNRQYVPAVFVPTSTRQGR